MTVSRPPSGATIGGSMPIATYQEAVMAYQRACTNAGRAAEAPAPELCHQAAGAWWLYARRTDQCIFAEVPVARVDCATGAVDLDVTESLGVFTR